MDLFGRISWLLLKEIVFQGDERLNFSLNVYLHWILVSSLLTYSPGCHPLHLFYISIQFNIKTKFLPFSSNPDCQQQFKIITYFSYRQAVWVKPQYFQIPLKTTPRWPGNWTHIKANSHILKALSFLDYFLSSENFTYSQKFPYEREWML